MIWVILAIVHVAGWVIAFGGLLVAMKEQGPIRVTPIKLVGILVLGLMFTFFWEFILIWGVLERMRWT